MPVPAASAPTSSLTPLAMALLPKELHDRVAVIPPSVLADLLPTVLGVSWDLRAEFLGIPDVNERIERVGDVLFKMIADKGLSPPDKRPDEGRQVIIRPKSRGQRPVQQLSEDLQPLQASYEQREPELNTAVKETITRELNRLAKIPPQSAEYGVSRTHIEWLLALPWNKVSPISDDLDLKEARRRLDEEHEGLDAVKRRVVEYLAVYRSVPIRSLG